MNPKILSKAATGERAQTSIELGRADWTDIAVQPADRLNLHSPGAGLIVRKRVGHTLVLDFDDGQSVALEGFYAQEEAQAAPTLVVSTGDLSEVFVGAADDANGLTEGHVHGTVIAAPDKGDDADDAGASGLFDGDGGLFSGSPPDVSALPPNGLGDATAARAASDAETLALGAGAASNGADDGTLWTVIAPFIPLFFAAAEFTRASSVNATAGADDGAKSPTIWIDGISTDTGESNTDFITNDTTLTVRGHVSQLANGQHLQVSSDGGVTWVEATVLADGQWSYEDPSQHGDSFTYQARIIDSANSVLTTASQAITVDTRASGAPGSNDGVAVAIIAINDDVAPVMGTVASSGTTNDTSPTLIGIDGSGTYAATNEFIVNSSWDSNTTRALLPRAISLDNGNFAVVWVSNANATTGMGYDVRAQLFNASWQRIGGEIAVTNEKYNQGYWPEPDGTTVNVDIDNLAVTAKSGGGFMVSWGGTDPSLSSSSLSNANIYSATFNSAGVAVGSRAQVNTGVTNNQLAPVSTTLNDGSTVVVWISNQAADYDVYSQRYDAAGNRIGIETRVNAVLAGNQGTLNDIQKELGVTALSNGGYVVVWAGRGSASTTEANVYMRVYSAAGTALSSQDTVINQSLKGGQTMPHVAALEGGGFIVTWSSQYGGTDQGADYAVMQRAYNNDGTLRPLALDTPELLVNVGATTNSQYGTSLSASSVNRNVAASWIERSSTAGYGTSTTETTKAALFDFGGRKIANLQVTNIAGDDGSFSGAAGKAAQVLALSNGNYVLAREAQNGTTLGDVWASIYGPTGAVVKADFVATSTNGGEQSGPAGLVELKDANGASTGQWVMLYIGKTASAPMQPQFGIFKANGDDALLTPDVVVSDHGPTASQGLIAAGAQESTASMAAAKGRFAVVWSDAVHAGADQSGDVTYLRIFSNDGTKLGTEIQVNVQTTNNQSAPKIAALADGSFLVTWVSNHAVSTAYDVYMQRFAADGTRLSSADQLVTSGFTSGNQGVYGTANAERAQQHDVVALAGGGWVVSYVDNSTGRNVLANIYDAAGNLMTSKLQLASVFSGTEEYYPSLTALSNGGFVASWTSTNTVSGDTSGTGTYMRYFDESGNVRSFSEFEAGGSPIAIEPGMLVGGSTNADAYNLERKAADPTFDIPTDGVSANYDTPSTLWKAQVTILNYQQGDVLGWDAAKASAAGITATYDGAGHLVMLVGASTTINGIEDLLRSVTYSGGATPVAGDRAIEFAIIDKAGATTTRESGITVDSPALGLTGTAGNDVLNGANGNDGILAMGGIDTVSAGNGDDRIYVSNPALSGQYQGGQGFDTLVLDFTGTQSVNLGALVGHAYGIERLELGNTSFVANSTSLRIDDLSNITSIVDAGVTRLLVQGSNTDSVTLANALNLTKVAMTSQDHVYFDIYQAAGNDIQLWLQQGMAVNHV